MVLVFTQQQQPIISSTCVNFNILIQVFLTYFFYSILYEIMLVRLNAAGCHLLQYLEELTDKAIQFIIITFEFEFETLIFMHFC